jgi:hypothetical protein
LFLPFFSTSCVRPSSKLYNIHLPALISSIFYIMDTVRTVKVCIFNLSFSFMGLLILYTVSEVDLNLQNSCLCASACVQDSWLRCVQKKCVIYCRLSNMLKIFYVVSICVTSPHVGVIANIVWTRAVRAVIRLLITFLREIGRLRLKIK